MTSKLRKTALIILTAAVLLLSFGCSENAQTKAITEAIVAYTDYYIEVRNLGDQVRAQSETVDSSAKSVLRDSMLFCGRMTAWIDYPRQQDGDMTIIYVGF